MLQIEQKKHDELYDLCRLNWTTDAIELLNDKQLDVMYEDGSFFMFAAYYKNFHLLNILVKYYVDNSIEEEAVKKYKLDQIYKKIMERHDVSDEIEVLFEPYAISDTGTDIEELLCREELLSDAFRDGDIQYLKQNKNDFWDFVIKNDRFELVKAAATKDHREIIDLIAEVMHGQYTKAAIYRHAALAIKDQDYNAAKKYLQQAIAIKKDYYPGYKLLGELYNEHGDTYRAADCFINTDIHKKSEQYTAMYSTLKQILNDSNNQSNTKFVKLAEKYKDQVKNQGLQIILKDISNNHTIKDEASVAESDHLTHEKSSESSDCTKDELPISSNVTTLSATALKQLDSDKSKDTDDLRIIDYIQGVDDVGVSSIGESSFQETDGHHTTA